MRKVLYTDFEDAGSIISEIISSPELKKAITRNNLYKFWDKVVGAKFAKGSKPYGMRGGGIMVIACKSSMIAQELMFRKSKILSEMTPFMKSLHVNVKDLVFDCKKSVVFEENENE
ncbi:DUF721 domain-containing protein [bacterium]|nr:DUF721 domain-containing protein [bacterium]